MSNEQIILNRIRLPNGTVLTSWHRHDYKEHRGYVVDGGNSYLRRGGPYDYEELSQYYDPDNHAHNRKYLHWGTRGKGGDQPVRRIAVENLDTDHIEAILETQWQIKGTYVEDILKKELEYRMNGEDEDDREESEQD